VILEQGAHGGELGLDILEWIAEHAPQFFSAARYEIIEPFTPLRERQHARLAKFSDKVRWYDSATAIDPFSGVHLSNELFDALPFHLIRSVAPGKWTERCVTIENDSFAFVTKPISDRELSARVARLPPSPAGFESEVNLAVRPLLEGIAQKLTHGYLLAIDYGFSAEQFYSEEHATGTLQCRAAHRLLDSPFVRVGESDITAHVEWTSLVEQAVGCGFSVAGFTDQHHFITGILAASAEWAETSSPKIRRALQTLLHPEMFGRSFQVLVLRKGEQTSDSLSGLRFARAARSQL
jgi:SAM-dependent MidA family methyltransferase